MKAPLCLAKVGEEISQVEMPRWRSTHLHSQRVSEHKEFVADVAQKDEGQRTRDEELNLSSVQSSGRKEVAVLLLSYCVKRRIHGPVSFHLHSFFKNYGK